jgi:PAS domain S-box-containing protein
MTFDEDDEFLLSMAGKVIITSFLRYNAEQKLSESEEKAHALLNASADSMILIDLEGRFLEVNERAAQLFNQSPEVLLNQRFHDFSPLRIAIKRNEIFQQVIKTGKRTEHFDSVNDRSYEHVIYPVFNTENVVDRIAVMTRDITEKLKNENQIKNQYHFLQALLNNLPNPVYYKDTDQRYLGCNQEFLKAIGKTYDEIIGKTIYEVQDFNVAEFHFSKDSLLLKDRNVQSFETSIRYADGLYHDILFNKAVFYNFDGKLGGLIGIMIDITEIKRYQTELKELNLNLEQRVLEELRKTEQQRQMLIQKSKLESLGKLAAGMAHEINQPLGGISMGLENILLKSSRNQLSDKYLNEKINYLYENISRIKLIIDHIRTFSRDQQKTAFSVVNLNDVIDSTLLLVGAQYSNHNVTLSIYKADNKLNFIGNHYKLEQVLLNLLSNAKDAVDERALSENQRFERKISIETALEGDFVSLSLQDNGTGISDEIRDQVFEPFFTTKEIAKGTGLGLSIAYGIIEEIRGSFIIDSKPGEYTKIKVLIPRVKEK